MVLELKTPHGSDLAALRPLVPVFLSYVLSYIYLGIYWNNHHHMLHAAQHVTGGALWANLHLLFWLSLVPFVTAWMGEAHVSPVPTAAYGFVLLMAALSWSILQRNLIRSHGPQSVIAQAFCRTSKENLSLLMYAIAIAIAFWQPWISTAIYAAMALLWLVPDRRVERAIGHNSEPVADNLDQA